MSDVSWKWGGARNSAKKAFARSWGMKLIRIDNNFL